MLSPPPPYYHHHHHSNGKYHNHTLAHTSKMTLMGHGSLCWPQQLSPPVTISRFYWHYFLTISTLTDAMRSTDVSASRASSSCTYHMLLVCLLVCFPSPFHMLSYFTDLDCRLIYAYCLTICFPLLSCQLVCRSLFLELWLISYSFRFAYLFRTICTCILCISQFTIYTGWRWGFVPHLQSTLQPP